LIDYRAFDVTAFHLQYFTARLKILNWDPLSTTEVERQCAITV